MLSERFRAIFSIFSVVVAIISAVAICNEPGVLSEKKASIAIALAIDLILLAALYFSLWIMKNNGEEIKIAGKRPIKED
jgi:hypothetical protein